MKHEDIWDLMLPPHQSHCEAGKATPAGIHTVLRSLPRCQSPVCISGDCAAASKSGCLGGGQAYLLCKRDWKAQLITSPCHTAITRGEMTE